MAETTKVDLFSGEPGFLGGLSNERELAAACPPEFKRDNKWSDVASRVFFGGADIKAWKFRDPEKRGHQLACFKAVISGFGLSHEHKEAVAGWMLSEMLTECPEWIEPK